MWAVWLLVLSGGLLAILSVPADISLEIERVQTLKVRLGLRWLFVRVRHELDPTSSKQRNEPKPRKGFRIPFRTLAAARKVPGLRGAARRFLRRLARSVRVLGIDGRIRMGTGDPADTGRLWALAGPGTLWLNRRSWVDVHVEPDFEGAGLTGTLGGTLRLYPARLAYAVLSAVVSITTARLVLAVLRSRPWAG